jgi:hypothetical protein
MSGKSLMTGIIIPHYCFNSLVGDFRLSEWLVGCVDPLPL